VKKLELRLSGFGGQGLITAGIILAEAAILDGMNAVQSQSYGPEARGGASRAEVIISTEEIDYPKVRKPDLCLSMSQEACDKYAVDTHPEGMLILDSAYVKKPPVFPGPIYNVPITETAVEKVGRSIVANIVALGVINGITNIVTEKSLESAVLERVPPKTRDFNRKALHLGYKVAQNLDQKGR
jgi:2-oxoglutarate ferredoxin oxidoreductase subunit gamma